MYLRWYKHNGLSSIIPSNYGKYKMETLYQTKNSISLNHDLYTEINEYPNVKHIAWTKMLECTHYTYVSFVI